MEFLSTCGSKVKSGHAPVTFKLYWYVTWTKTNPFPVAVILTNLVFLDNLKNNKYIYNHNIYYDFNKIYRIIYRKFLL